MTALFLRISRSSILVAKSFLVALLTLSTAGLCAQQDDPDRPRLSHQSQPIPQTDPPIDPLGGVPANAPPRTPIGEGLVLMSFGHVWARDTFDGKPQLVQLRFLPTKIDQHVGSNLLKTNLAPFVYKPKASIEIEGAAANVRLHDPHVSIYVRGFSDWSGDAAPSSETSTRTDLMLVRAESKKDRRIISTVAFTQITAKAARSEDTVAFTMEKVGNSDWRKITPNDPLPPGEYALMFMPRGQNLFPTRVFDFAVDPKAPTNSGVITPAADAQSK
jgi:hypothetical protein